MLATLIILVLGLNQPSISVHLVASDDPPAGPKHPPAAGFVGCSDCREARVVLAGREQLVRYGADPFIEISSGEVAQSSIHVSTTVYDPEKLLYTLFVSLDDSTRVSAEVGTQWNERVLVRVGDRVTNLAWIGPSWERAIPVGLFDSLAEARALAHQLNQEPVEVPFDRRADERRRTLYLCSVLGDYADRENPREEVERDDPDLFEFLNRYPRYWGLLTDESCV